MLTRKTLYKALTWRLISIVLSFALSIAFFGDFKASLWYTLAYGVVSTVLYIAHELLYKWLKKRRLESRQPND
jgi:uncharacterized membrane protein